MPIENGVGTSGNTFEKQQVFHRVMQMHTRIVRGAMKHSWVNKKYFYFDLTAGPGLCLLRSKEGERPELFAGSPLLAIGALEDAGLDYNALLIEKNPGNYDVLCSALRKRPLADIKCGDCCDLLLEWLEEEAYRFKGGQKMGLCYVDPSGNPPPFELLSTASRHPEFKRIDILISFSPTNIKRWRRNPKLDYDGVLTELLWHIDKTQWFVREPMPNGHCWSFLLGTNWKGYPLYKSAKFHKVGTRSGNALLEQLTWAKTERKGNEQLAIPFV